MRDRGELEHFHALKPGVERRNRQGSAGTRAFGLHGYQEPVFGIVRFGAPSSGHDDTVAALIGAYALAKESGSPEYRAWVFKKAQETLSAGW